MSLVILNRIIKRNGLLQKFKKKNALHHIHELLKIKKPSANIVFAKGGVESLIEKPGAFSRNLLFILLFFVIW